jgi:hypothetical protein
MSRTIVTPIVRWPAANPVTLTHLTLVVPSAVSEGDPTMVAPSSSRLVIVH